MGIELFRVIKNDDHVSDKAWWKECNSRNIPFVIVRIYRAKADIQWDCSSLDQKFDSCIKESDHLSGFIRGVFCALSNGTEEGICGNFEGTLYKLPVEKAEKAAESISYALNDIINFEKKVEQSKKFFES